MKRGFTLIELLVVMGVIAVLVSLALPGISKGRAVARRIACRSNLAQLHKATQAVWVKEGMGQLPDPPGENAVSGIWIEPAPICPGDRRELYFYVFSAWTHLTEHQIKHPDDVVLTLSTGQVIEWDFPLWSCGWTHGQHVTWSGAVR